MTPAPTPRCSCVRRLRDPSAAPDLLCPIHGGVRRGLGETVYDDPTPQPAPEPCEACDSTDGVVTDGEGTSLCPGCIRAIVEPAMIPAPDEPNSKVAPSYAKPGSNERVETVARVLREHRQVWYPDGGVGCDCEAMGPWSHERHQAAAVVAALDDETARLAHDFAVLRTASDSLAADRDASRAALDRVRAEATEITPEAIALAVDPDVTDRPVDRENWPDAWRVYDLLADLRAALDSGETR